MRVELAGYNVDTTVIAEAQRLGVDQDLLTPEPISAAYARISRYKKPVDELRRQARSEVAKARRSNQRIIWEMGHHSVAEHAVFNFDLLGLSRLAIEALEHFRLCSFTEKSQRYITLDGDYVLPREIEQAQLSTEFAKLVTRQNDLYRDINSRIFNELERQRPEQAASKAGKKLLRGEAKEDARYITALATEGQLGLTLNARNLELVIRRLAAHSLAEVRQLSAQLYEQVKRVAPSLVLFVDACEHDQLAYSRLQSEVGELPQQSEEATLARSCPAKELSSGSVRLVDATAHADRRLVAAILHTVSGQNYEQCYGRAVAMNGQAQRALIESAMRNMELFDAALREFEHIGCSFEIALSAACFGQLKRHRMMTLTTQPYDPDLGITLPAAVAKVGLEENFREVARVSERLASRIAEHAPTAAPYALLNAHRRRVLVSLNARELYHVSRLREDKHAQWDIRILAAELIAQAKQLMPLALMLSGGKDTYPERYEALYGAPPKVVVANLPIS